MTDSDDQQQLRRRKNAASASSTRTDTAKPASQDTQPRAAPTAKSNRQSSSSTVLLSLLLAAACVVAFRPVWYGDWSFLTNSAPRLSRTSVTPEQAMSLEFSGTGGFEPLTVYARTVVARSQSQLRPVMDKVYEVVGAVLQIEEKDMQQVSQAAIHRIIALWFHVSATVHVFQITRKLLCRREGDDVYAGMATTSAFFGALFFAVHPVHTSVIGNPSNLAFVIAVGFALASFNWLLSAIDAQSLVHRALSFVMAVAAFGLALLGHFWCIALFPLAVFSMIRASRRYVLSKRSSATTIALLYVVACAAIVAAVFVVGVQPGIERRANTRVMSGTAEEIRAQSQQNTNLNNNKDEDAFEWTAEAVTLAFNQFANNVGWNCVRLVVPDEATLAQISTFVFVAIGGGVLAAFFISFGRVWLMSQVPVYDPLEVFEGSMAAAFLNLIILFLPPLFTSHAAYINGAATSGTKSALSYVSSVFLVPALASAIMTLSDAAVALATTQTNKRLDRKKNDDVSASESATDTDASDVSDVDVDDKTQQKKKAIAAAANMRSKAAAAIAQSRRRPKKLRRTWTQTGLIGIVIGASVFFMLVMSPEDLDAWRNDTTLLMRSVKLVPSRSQADRRVSESLATYRSGDREAGLRELRSVAEEFPDEFQAVYNYATALRYENKLEASVDYYLRGIKLRPGFIKSYSMLSELYVKLDRDDDAIAISEQALTELESQEKQNEEQRGKLKADDTEGRERLNKALTEIHHDMARIHFGLAQVYYKTKDNRALLKHAREAHTLHPEHEQIKRLLDDLERQLQEARVKAAQEISSEVKVTDIKVQAPEVARDAIKVDKEGLTRMIKKQVYDSVINSGDGKMHHDDVQRRIQAHSADAIAKNPE